ncbi:DUF4269 domain-containing protein [Bacteroides sp. 519]|uniref:DUF4269 domain-containing protein n=1 Tax=Bacteroides sp. 519 TaxID=2302937 RepID=UPI0013D4773F|nr:DUF4269 domain-containing protein [Bacteroides sp. 519]NDV59541.1 DUF4269 domain-containing protein [Bacteroides sp. 519]
MNYSFFDTIDYLRTGNNNQQRVYEVLQQSRIMDILHPFTPILTGTFPLDINVSGSDLDIVCCFSDKEKFIEIVQANFASNKQFCLSFKDNNIVIANFIFMDTEFEIYATNVPVKEQNAYIHMINEYKLLNKFGADFKAKIILLKQNGMKTEPAFAHLLELKGDPYKAMLNINDIL